MLAEGGDRSDEPRVEEILQEVQILNWSVGKDGLVVDADELWAYEETSNMTV